MIIGNYLYCGEYIDLKGKRYPIIEIMTVRECLQHGFPTRQLVLSAL